ncbi:MAG: hypothetical protein QOE31_1933 [Solirubrobacteraceae bacterium]|jgi:hypothetical protein|nr:hypothetical protein [Solirubrobacteraceae bacterium]
MTAIATPRPADAIWRALTVRIGAGSRDVARDRLRELAANLPLAAAGGVPVTLIAGSAFGLALRTLALLILAPVVAMLLARVAVHRATRTLVVRAVTAGIVATAMYDLCRGSFLWSGLMDHDPIPHIGAALGLDPAWAAGYTWRYLGNGTGLALTFLALGLRGTRAGIGYGLAVCSCLLLTLVASPYGTEILFPLNVTTVIMAVLGHAIYGAVLGTLAARWRADAARPPALRPSTRAPSPRRNAARAASAQAA